MTCFYPLRNPNTEDLTANSGHSAVLFVDRQARDVWRCSTLENLDLILGKICKVLKLDV